MTAIADGREVSSHGVPRTMDGYIRVSRVAGREGESFISPDAQRKKIQAWAELHEIEIVRWWEELDASGAQRDRPMFQLALERCERGETGGVVVARLDRFARSAVDALEGIRRLNEAGARLVSVEDRFDGSTPMGRFAIGILTLIAELELERIKESWSTAVRSAVERGIHISGTPPAGYERELLANGKRGKLVPVEPDASFIAEAFRKRALGASWTELADFLTAHQVRSSKGSAAWSVNGARTLIMNRAYLGEARSGAIANAHAHEPIVTHAEFDAAQSTSSLLTPHDGSVAAKALLGRSRSMRRVRTYPQDRGQQGLRWSLIPGLLLQRTLCEGHVSRARVNQSELPGCLRRGAGPRGAGERAWSSRAGRTRIPADRGSSTRSRRGPA